MIDNPVYSRTSRFLLMVPVLAMATAVCSAQSFNLLDDLQPGLTAGSQALGISGNGTVVFGSGSLEEFVNNSVEIRKPAVAWSGSDIRQITAFSNNDSEVDARATAASFDGSTIVGWGTCLSDDECPFISINNVTQVFSDWGRNGIDRVRADAVSDDGSTIVGRNGWAFKRKDGIIELFDGGAGYGLASANGVAGDGNIFVGSTGETAGPEFGERPYIRAGDTLTFLSSLRGDAIAVTSDGSTVVGYLVIEPFAKHRAFKWTNETGAILLDDTATNPIAIESAWDVSDDGAVIIGGASDRTAAIADGFVWTEATGRRLMRSVLEQDLGVDTSQWLYVVPTGISADGRVIAGTAWSHTFQPTAWRAELSAQPVAWATAAGGVFGEGSNWVGGSVPDETQEALFDASFFAAGKRGDSVTVTFDAVAATTGLHVADAQVTLDLQGHSYGIKQLTVGATDDAELVVRNGGCGVDVSTRRVLIGDEGLSGSIYIEQDGILEVTASTIGLPALVVGYGGGVSAADQKRPAGSRNRGHALQRRRRCRRLRRMGRPTACRAVGRYRRRRGRQRRRGGQHRNRRRGAVDAAPLAGGRGRI